MIVAIAVWAQIQLGAVVRPETVTVGDHFSMTVRVRAPQGSTITFPVRPDSSSAIDTAGPMSRHDTPGAGFTESEVTYTLAAWEVGRRALGLGDIVVTGPLGERRVSLANDSIYIRSVLPADTALRKPKPLRPLIPVRLFNWVPWLIAALVVLALFGAWRLWVWWRRRRAAPVNPGVWAEQEFQRVEAMALLDASHPEQHAILMAEVLREYLARQFGSVHRSATTRQLSDTLRAESSVRNDRVITLLEQIDLLKFARGTLARPSAETVGTEAKAIVRDIEARLRAAAAAPQERAA
jgi:hypothetical protein